MAGFDPFRLRRAHTARQFDVFISFTRADPGGSEAVRFIKSSLESAGLHVFWDEDIKEFDGITQDLVDALASAKVLLAYFSEQFPTRYACQWELTAALIAARRHGNPADRVLVVNPEGPLKDSHLKPIELADARFFAGPVTPGTIDTLVDRVVKKVRAADRPLGSPRRSSDPAGIPARILRPRRFIGRYPDMWDIHSGLHASDFPAVRLPESRPAVMVQGIAGQGKTSLAEQYAYLYRDAFPGGMFWLEPFGALPSPTNPNPGSILPRYHAALRHVADGIHGLQAEGADPARLSKMIADHLTGRRERVLWVIDDVPAGVPPDVLDQLLIPSPVVRTILTGRGGAPGWDVRSVELRGLSQADGRLLFAMSREPASVAEQAAVDDFIRRCDGHPMAIRGAANAARNRPDLIDSQDFADHINRTSPFVIRAIRDDLANISALARRLLQVAAVLAPVPFPARLASRILGCTEGMARERLGSAADELAAGGFLSVVDGAWQVHGLVTEAVGTEESITSAAAPAVLAALGETAGDDLVQHAETLARNADVAASDRVSLLRLVGTSYQRHGNLIAAAEVFGELLAIDAAVADLLTAAEAEIGCAHYDKAVDHARRATANTDDHRLRYRARLLAARALDAQARYGEADQEFWDHYGERPAVWMSVEERLSTTLAISVRQRQRGRPKDAVAALRSAVTELRAAPPGPLRDDIGPSIRLELARVLQLTGKARQARVIAGEVVDEYTEAGMPRHGRRLEALAVQAEATLTLDFTEVGAASESWSRSAAGLGELKAQYTELLGADNPLTLEIWVKADRALLALGRPEEALSALSATDDEIARRLGPDHVLRLRARHGMATAHGQLREFGRQAEILEELLPQQIDALGNQHPETVETQLDLGTALLMGDCGQRKRAVDLVDEAAKTLRDVLGSNVDLSAKATTAQWVLRLPQWMVGSYLVFERLLGTKKEK
ncbi:TIR domain-containing protein [Amycolatopsis sp. SB7-3]|uniref:TIR domain-containing protein n=1 Tax=Amycolatopsis sp. SB7-3 TaxID=3373438 RepID=UPI003744976F